MYCFPHARGDGPSESALPPASLAFSPRAWGWSASRPRRVPPRFVFPTRVGMVRLPTPAAPLLSCFPHARGDGPLATTGTLTITLFSPRAWGWSVCSRLTGRPRSVFPTRVGMVRSRTAVSRCPPRFPHARGDGPPPTIAETPAVGFSPRAWGWSGLHLHPRHRRHVFPTRVGMVRTTATRRSPAIRFPHARGDGPDFWHRQTLPDAFSPRAWGWSAHPCDRPRSGRVFPTRVGMVRKATSCNPRRSSFPHARGDGPRRGYASSRGGGFSPRAWGWSVKRPAPVQPGGVFPTRVGMVRTPTAT